MKRLTSGISLAFALMAAPAFAQTVAVTNVTLALGDGGEPIPDATVVMRDGRILAAGRGVAVPP
nr:amidohydrolase [Pseudomonadota bacterium]